MPAILSRSAVEELRCLITQLPTEDGKDCIADMICWAAKYSTDLMRELDANRVSTTTEPGTP